MQNPKPINTEGNIMSEQTPTPAITYQNLNIIPVAQLVPASQNTGLATAPISDKQLATLMRDLNPNRVAKREGMSYLEAWDVKAHLTRVFGFGGFSSEVLASQIIFAQQVPQARDKNKTNWKVAAQVTLRLSIHQFGAVFTEVAVAGSSQPDFTESADMALKSAESDALKRAAISLGTQFGLSLYDNGSTADVIRAIVEPHQEELLANLKKKTANEKSVQPAADEIAPPAPSAEAEAAADQTLARGFQR
jgi:recombination DNA repair RAD52 pathway protein